VADGPRVVSLVPSVTETLLAWGVRPIAVTRFCEQPDLVKVGGTKDPDLAAVVALAPDLVVMDAEENRREDYEALVSAGVPVHATAVRRLADVDPAMSALAEAVGARWEPLGERPAPEPAHRAFVPIWRRPWMALGAPSYGQSILAALGWAVVPDGLGPYPEMGPADVASQHPDLVVAPSEPYPFGPRHRAELEVAGPVAFVDGHDLFWWGTRTAGALGRLAAALEAGLAGQ
jgi:ABC-type Fe3+-hydroxamate transport system substrate-binding protein